MNGPVLDEALAAELERDSVEAMGAPFAIARPKIWRAPVIFASPHSGHIYPDSFLARAACDLATLRLNEDAFMDKLFGHAAALGAPLLSARFPRCFVDVNRAPSELPRGWGKTDSPSKLTARAEAGFGVIPLMIAQNTPIYAQTPPKEITLQRLAHLYEPYHKALQDLIGEAVSLFGRAIVIDCHSMPGFAAMGARRADIVLGDRFGLSCSADTLACVETAFVNNGYSVVKNSPYAGGFVTTHYGRSAKQPTRVVETLQIEVNRDLYLNPVTLEAKPRHYADLSEKLEDIIYQIIDTFKPRSAEDVLAAE